MTADVLLQSYRIRSALLLSNAQPATQSAAQPPAKQIQKHGFLGVFFSDTPFLVV